MIYDLRCNSFYYEVTFDLGAGGQEPYSTLRCRDVISLKPDHLNHVKDGSGAGGEEEEADSLIQLRLVNCAEEAAAHPGTTPHPGTSTDPGVAKELLEFRTALNSCKSLMLASV